MASTSFISGAGFALSLPGLYCCQQVRKTWLNDNSKVYDYSCNGLRGDGAAGHGIPVRHVEVAGERCRAYILRARRLASLTQLWEIRLKVLEKCVAGLLRCCSAVNISFQLGFGVVGAAQQIIVAVEALQAKGDGLSQRTCFET